MEILDNERNLSDVTLFFRYSAEKKSFSKKIERNLSTTILKPKDILVNLKGGGQANVAVFNLEAMILSLVLDEILMHHDNIAEGYDIFTGKGSQPDDVYGEIHTGDAWKPAWQHFCGDDSINMPLALVFFGDKSHWTCTEHYPHYH